MALELSFFLNTFLWNWKFLKDVHVRFICMQSTLPLNRSQGFEIERVSMAVKL
jgi:hypothetical protein